MPEGIVYPRRGRGCGPRAPFELQGWYLRGLRGKSHERVGRPVRCEFYLSHPPSLYRSLSPRRGRHRAPTFVRPTSDDIPISQHRPDPQIADLSFTLEDHQVEEGLPLLCMSWPLEDCEVETQADWGYSLDTQDWPGPTGYILGKEVDSISNEANT